MKVEQFPNMGAENDTGQEKTQKSAAQEAEAKEQREKEGAPEEKLRDVEKAESKLREFLENFDLEDLKNLTEAEAIRFFDAFESVELDYEDLNRSRDKVGEIISSEIQKRKEELGGEEEYKKGSLRKVRKLIPNKFTKAAATLAAAFMISPGVSAYTGEGAKEEIHSSAYGAGERKSEGAYNIAGGPPGEQSPPLEEEEEGNIEDEDKSILNAKQYFEINESKIEEEGKQEIENRIVNFFKDMVDGGEVDATKLDDFLEKEVVIKASASETPREEGTNEELAENRAKALKNAVLENLDDISRKLKDIDFHNRQVEKIIDNLRVAKTEIPEHRSENEKRAGITYITDMTNPETGSYYTEEEVEKIKENDPERYKQLLKDARCAEINLTAEKKDPLDLDIDLEEKGIPPELIEIMNYSESGILLDVSPSATNSSDNPRTQMVEKIKEAITNIRNSEEIEDDMKTIKTGAFSEELMGEIEETEVENADEAVRDLVGKEYEGTLGRENPIQAAARFLEKMDRNKRSVLYVITDEMLHLTYSNLKDLEQKADEKNVDVKFLVKIRKVFDSRGNEIRSYYKEFEEFSLNDVKNDVSKDPKFKNYPDARSDLINIKKENRTYRCGRQ